MAYRHFENPAILSAQRALGAIIAILAFLLVGIAYLAYSYGIVATVPGDAAYESVLSQLLAAVAGKGLFYAISIASIVLVLCLSANTSFADCPRLCRTVADDEYLPHAFANRGRRLVYSDGICVLAASAALLLIVFDGCHCSNCVSGCDRQVYPGCVDCGFSRSHLDRCHAGG